MYTLSLTITENVAGWRVHTYVWDEEQGQPRVLVMHHDRHVSPRMVPEHLEDLEALREVAWRSLHAVRDAP